jgi:CheY-like chemotaxis protein
MRILVVEDDEDKRRQVCEFLRSFNDGISIVEARSLQSGLQAIRTREFDMFIFDMTIPTFDIAEGEDGGRPQAFGGRELLRHMMRMRVTTPALVLTQFDRFGERPNVTTLKELEVELRTTYPRNFVEAIHYDLSDQL